MFKAIALGLAMLAGTQAIKMQHQDNGNLSTKLAINVQQLTDEQQEADNFFKRRIPSLENDALANGEQDGKYFRFQYVSQESPFTITEVEADRVEEDSSDHEAEGHVHKTNFKLINTIRSSSGNVQNGRITSIKKAYEVDSFSDAMSNLDWD